MQLRQVKNLPDCFMGKCKLWATIPMLLNIFMKIRQLHYKRLKNLANRLTLETHDRDDPPGESLHPIQATDLRRRRPSCHIAG